jgi:enoyl-CoA hydratase/carnithine racemase
VNAPIVQIERRGNIALLRFNRPDKRNAVNDTFIGEIENFFTGPPEEVKAVVLTGEGGHFCAGLDLSEHKERDAYGVVQHSRWWHRVLERVEFGGLPVVAAMHGAVIGGGLEIAMAAHVRVADETAFYQLPEGRRGIYVGGGASVRVARVIGGDRMREMMLTGRRYDAADGLRLGLSHYVEPKGTALDKALALATEVAGNARLSNYMMIQALTRIQNMDEASGLFVESLAAGLAQTSPEAQEGLRAFLEKRDANFGGKK